MKGRVEFVFHYRITEFMRLVVDDFDVMEKDVIANVASWMLRKISERGCSFSVRFSMNEETEVKVDTITVKFLMELLGTCQKRRTDKVNFEVDSEPRTVCWVTHTFTNEAMTERTCESNALETIDDGLEFDSDFVDFLEKLEQRQEMIKESALHLLSLRSGYSHDQGRIEKSVQTSPATLSANLPQLEKFHGAQLDIESVENFVDSLFDFDQKFEHSSRGGVLQRSTAPRFLSSKKIDWDNKNVVKCWGKSMNKKWELMQHKDRLSMTAALSTGVGGMEGDILTVSCAEKRNKKLENDEGSFWIAGLLKMLEQKPGRSRKLLKGLLSFSKEHKALKSSKSRNCDFCRGNITNSKSSEFCATAEAIKKHDSSILNDKNCDDVYTYMKKKLKEHEKAKKFVEKQCGTETEVGTKKCEKEKNQEDIRAYLVGRKITKPSCKTCGARIEIRDSVAVKKVKQAQNLETALTNLTLSPLKQDQSKFRKTKPSSKQRVTGKYFILTKTPTLAVIGESPVNYIGRLSNTESLYGKTFKMINLSRKEINLSVIPIKWPDHVNLVHPLSSAAVGPGHTKDIAVTIKRSSASVGSECYLLSVIHRNNPISHSLSFTVDAISAHYEGPLLSEVYGSETLHSIIAHRVTPDINHSTSENMILAAQATSVASDTIAAVHTVVDMLKEEVDSVCNAILPSNESEQLTDSIYTAIEGDSDDFLADMKRSVLSINEEDPCDDTSDFEIVDVDKLGRVFSRQQTIVFEVQ
ncbi:hypothetical protein DICVIV_10411 [Dictyocaulus viviparus]|uniref:Uncharacterized protein n=1 Tax=Dictyocaulus viviparus TaxID=29172 RepID=A0A0D8XII2_DICVI|nr:hypothetical protein DICVIV_10411 [Dictyocaulus viviparus]